MSESDHLENRILSLYERTARLEKTVALLLGALEAGTTIGRSEMIRDAREVWDRPLKAEHHD